MNRWGAACAIILGGCLIFFQNFSVPGQGAAPVAKLVLPAKATLARPAADFPGVPDCALKNTIFLHFKGIADGERVTGSIEDTDSHARVTIDIVAGRDFVAGNCDDLAFREAGVVKICFPEAAGPYFEASLKGDSFELNKAGFASSAHCEAAPTISVDLALRGGAR